MYCECTMLMYGITYEFCLTLFVGVVIHTCGLDIYSISVFIIHIHEYLAIIYQLEKVLYKPCSLEKGAFHCLYSLLRLPLVSLTSPVCGQGDVSTFYLYYGLPVFASIAQFLVGKGSSFAWAQDACRILQKL